MHLVFAAQISRAVILFGSGDPKYNTTPPTGTLTNSGWQYEGQWGPFLGTPIAPHYFLAAQHIGGSVGQTFTFNGSNYTTTAYYDDPASDLRIWMVSGTFPTYAPLYSTNDEQGKSLVVIGRGTQRGAPVMVASTSPGSTNSVNTLAGWMDGPSDGVMRWGVNQVDSAGGWLLEAAFTGTQGPNEGFLSPGDSAGAVFMQDNSGTWRLAGINYGIEGPFTTCTNGGEFFGAIFNEDGLFIDYDIWSQPQDGVQRPAHFYASRVSNEMVWIQGVTGVIPPPPSNSQTATTSPLVPPQLSLQASGNNVVLSYPTNAVGFNVQSCSGLGGGVAWQNLTNPAILIGTNWSITLPMAATSGFFRLQSGN